MGRFSYVLMPDQADLANPDRYSFQKAYDILGRWVSRDGASRLQTTEESGRTLAPENGPVAIDETFIDCGRARVLHREQVGTEPSRSASAPARS